MEDNQNKGWSKDSSDGYGNSLNIDAETLVKKSVFLSVLAGAIPLTLIDLATVTGIQLRMIRKLCELYGERFSKNKGKKIITALGGSLAARGGASLIKMIPGIGTLIGSISMPLMSGGSTYAIGMLIKDNFNSGKDLWDLEAENIAEKYKEYYKQSKSILENWQNEIEDLRERGAISEEGYQKMKQIFIKLMNKSEHK